MHGHHDRNDFTDHQVIIDLIYLLLADVVQYLNFKYTVQHITLYYTMGMLCDCIMQPCKRTPKGQGKVYVNAVICMIGKEMLL